MSTPANRKSSSGSRRFNPLKALQPKRRLQQMLSSPSAFDYCRFIELDYIPMEAGIMVSMRQSRGFLSPERHNRRPAVAASARDTYGTSSLSSSSGSCRGSEGSPVPRRQVKYTSCTDNHGIRPPPPEQYLTPLQQKEVCIRHLRARLKETIDKLQDRDTEIDELKTQLSRMQEDWIEEECHRVEAQLALKEARKEIQQLKQVIDVVRSNLGHTDSSVQKCFQDINMQNHKLETLLYNMELAQNGSGQGDEGAARSGVAPSGSCDGSPARSLTRSSTYTKLSDQALADRNGNAPDFPSLSGEETMDSGCVCGSDSRASRADLLLEATLLSEETSSLLSSFSRLPHSSTYEKLCSGEQTLPLRCSRTCSSHPCLAHHHLFLHHLREQAIQTDYGSASASANLGTIAERAFRSQACSPTSTWLSEEGEDFDTVTSVTATTADPAPHPLPASPSCAVDLPPLEDEEAPLQMPEPQMCQPKSTSQIVGGVTVVVLEEEEEDGEEGAQCAIAARGAASAPPQKSYWSRHFLVDLLAVAMPVVPAVAWLCRGPRREGQPVYHIGSLLRGCCTVALHSLRRGGGTRHYPAGGGDGLGGMQI